MLAFAMVNTKKNCVFAMLGTWSYKCTCTHVIGRMPIAYRGKDERVERVLMYYCTSSLLALVQDAAEEPSTYCFADTLETKRDALSARRGSCQKSEKLIPTPCVVFRDRNPL